MLAHPATNVLFVKSVARISAFVLLATLASMSASQGSSGDVALSSESPKPADAFADAIGVDTHFSYPGTAYIVAWPKVSAALVKSGFRHFRDGYISNDPAAVERVRSLGEHGLKDTLGFHIGASPADIRSALNRLKPYVEAVEPSNEYDAAAKKDPDWEAHIRADQQKLYATVHDGFKGITVLGPSMAHTPLMRFADLAPYEDAANLHAYFCRRHPAKEQFAEPIAVAQAGSKPVWTTETGSGDKPGSRCGLPDEVIAKYDTRIVAEAVSAGEPRIFFYQFADTPGDVGFGTYGLLTADGDLKPQYTALASLSALLSDPGPAFAMKPLHYEVDGANIDHLLLEKRSGVYDLLLWQEVRGYRDTPSGGAVVPIAPENVTVSVGGARPGQYYSFDANWALKGANVDARTGGSVHVPVTDAISVLEIRP